MIGFVTVFGITVRNSILIISHYEHMVEVEGMNWNLATAIKGAGDWLTPILMTSLVTGLGLLPLAPLGGGAGAGDQGTDGHRHSRWSPHFNGVEPTRAADTSFALRTACDRRTRTRGETEPLPHFARERSDGLPRSQRETNLGNAILKSRGLRSYPCSRSK